jgi:hypothetical protein
MKTKLAILAVLISAASQAAPLTFRFDTSMDTTRFGGAPATPLSVVYTFDSALPEVPIDPGYSGYEPVTMQIHLGNETVSGLVGFIEIFNNSTGEDGYGVHYLYSFGGPSYQLLGRRINALGFTLQDRDTTMFNSTALPLDTAFVGAVDSHSAVLQFQEGFTLSQEPFSLVAVPEPSTLSMLFAAGLLAGAVWLKRKIRSHFCHLTLKTLSRVGLRG